MHRRGHCLRPEAAVSRLENGENANPTVNILLQYADAPGKQLPVLMTDKAAK